jgi:crossover junction endodeoxyribonuclease RusA
MPASRPKRTRSAGQAWHTTRPDLSKLIRSTEDALTDAGLIHDDARICWLTVTKAEVISWTGADITIGPARDIP